jgi:hypothetical protein
MSGIQGQCRERFSGVFAPFSRDAVAVCVPVEGAGPLTAADLCVAARWVKSAPRRGFPLSGI